MRGARDDSHDAAVVDVLAAAELDGRVVDGIELEAEDAHGHVAGEALGEVVDEEMDVHGVWGRGCSLLVRVACRLAVDEGW